MLRALKTEISYAFSKIPEHLHTLRYWVAYLSPKTKILLLVLLLLIAGLIAVAITNLFTPSNRSLMQELNLGPLTNKQDGDVWVISLISGQPLMPIKESGNKPGVPIKVTPDVQVVYTALSIGLIAEGQAGEKYIPGVRKNGQWLDAPTFEVVDQSGKVLGGGQFEYG